MDGILKSTGNTYEKVGKMIKRGHRDNPNRCIVAWLVSTTNTPYLCQILLTILSSFSAHCLGFDFPSLSTQTRAAADFCTRHLETYP